MDSYLRCDYIDKGFPLFNEFFVNFDVVRNKNWYVVPEREVVYANKMDGTEGYQGFLKVDVVEKDKILNQAMIELNDSGDRRRSKAIVHLNDILDENAVKKELLSRICSCVGQIKPAN